MAPLMPAFRHCRFWPGTAPPPDAILDHCIHIHETLVADTYVMRCSSCDWMVTASPKAMAEYATEQHFAALDGCTCIYAQTTFTRDDDIQEVVPTVAVDPFCPLHGGTRHQPLRHDSEGP